MFSRSSTMSMMSSSDHPGPVGMRHIVGEYQGSLRAVRMRDESRHLPQNREHQYRCDDQSQ